MNPEKRLTFTGTVYVQLPGVDVTEVSCAFSSFLKSEEQPYDRRTRCENNWEILQSGWMENNEASLIVILNQNSVGSPNLHVKLDEQSDNYLIIVPGRSATFKVKNLSKLQVRSSHETLPVKYRYLIIPE